MADYDAEMPLQHQVTMLLRHPGANRQRIPIATLRHDNGAPLHVYAGDSACYVVHTVDAGEVRVWVTTVDPDRWRWPPVVRRLYYRLTRAIKGRVRA